MQGRHRRVKRQKLDSDESAIIESANCEPATDDSVMIDSTLCDPLQLKVTIGQQIDADAYKLAHDDGMAIPDEYYRNSPVDSGRVDDILAYDTLPVSCDKSVQQSCSPSTTQSSASKALTHQNPSNASLDTTLHASGSPGLQNPDQTLETHERNMNPPTTTSNTREIKRVVLNESGYQLADVLKALEEANDTCRIPDSFIPGVSECLLTENTSMDYSKIMTGLVVNCVKFNRRIARPALDIKQERLRNFERDQLERIAKDRQQMNMTLPERTAAEMNYQKLENRLRRSTEDNISRLDVKELAESEFRETISEPTELTGEFREESDYENAIEQIEIEEARDTRTQQRRLWKEAYYWPMIQQRAKMIAVLPTPSGPKSEVTP